MKLFRRILLHILGFALLSFSVALILKTNQGSFPYDGIAYYISMLINHPFFTIGVASIIFGFVWVLLNLILIRKWYVLQSAIIVFTFGYFMDFWYYIVFNDYSITEVWLNAIIAVASLVVLGFSISLIIFNKRFPMGPSEIFLTHITTFTKKTLLSKLYIELALITILFTLAIIAGSFEQFGWFTFVSVIMIAPVISYSQKFLSKFIEVY